jgi:hypothetical protein
MFLIQPAGRSFVRSFVGECAIIIFNIAAIIVAELSAKW